MGDAGWKTEVEEGKLTILDSANMTVDRCHCSSQRWDDFRPLEPRGV